MSDMVSTGQAAIMLGVTAPTVISYFEKGLLDGCVLPSGHRRISRESIDRLKAERAK